MKKNCDVVCTWPPISCREFFRYLPLILGSSSGQVGPYDAGVGAGSYGAGSGAGCVYFGAGSYGAGVGEPYGGGAGFSTHEASHFSLDSNRLLFPPHPL